MFIRQIYQFESNKVTCTKGTQNDTIRLEDANTYHVYKDEFYPIDGAKVVDIGAIVTN